MAGRKANSGKTSKAEGGGPVYGKTGRPTPVSYVRLENIEVTQADIDNAMRANSNACMIADAIKRQRPELVKVSVDLATIRWTDTKRHRRVMALTPQLCQAKLAAFDFGVKPQPFVFSLRATQVTKVEVSRKVVDADGKAVKVSSTSGKVRTKRELVQRPSGRKVISSVKRGEVTITGGRLPPQNKASLKREFGIRAFTWAEGENPRDIASRREALGVAMPGEQ